MSGAKVIQLLRIRIQSCDKQTAQRLDAGETSNVAIDTGDNRLRIAALCSVCANQTNEMCNPHPRGQTFAADIAKRQYETITRLFDTKEVTRQMTNCKNLARHIETAVSYQSLRTQSTMHLRGFEDRSVQLSVILL